MVNQEWGTAMRGSQGRADPALHQGPSGAFPGLGPAGELGTQGGGRRCITEAPEPPPWPPMSRGLEALANHSATSVSVSGERWPSGWAAGCGPCLLPHFGGLRNTGPVGSWAPGSSVMTAKQSGYLALREPPTEVGLLLARTWALEGESYALGIGALLSGQRITLVW